MCLPLRRRPRGKAEPPSVAARRRQGVPWSTAGSLPPRPSPLGRTVPISRSKPWASFSCSLSISPSLLLPGCQGKALPALCRAGLPLDKPHLWGELVLTTASVVHAISSVLPTDKKRLEQKLPLLQSGLLENPSLPLSIPGLCTPERWGVWWRKASVPHAWLWGAPARVPARVELPAPPFSGKGSDKEPPPSRLRAGGFVGVRV